MFVRLFADENLTRTIPISRQPKEKIQAILDACNRQFPEFHGRARKRLRTYLKSCRRNKKANNGKDDRVTAFHMSSGAADAILAKACENENFNATRMRMGLEPISVWFLNFTIYNHIHITYYSQAPGPPASKSPPSTKAAPPPANPVLDFRAADYLRFQPPMPNPFRVGGRFDVGNMFPGLGGGGAPFRHTATGFPTAPLGFPPTSLAALHNNIG